MQKLILECFVLKIHVLFSRYFDFASTGDGLAGASQSGVHNVDEQPLCSSEIMPGVQRNLQASKGGPQSGVAGPQTLEIIQDRGRSPSTDSVPLTELFASRTSGMATLPLRSSFAALHVAVSLYYH